MTNIPIAYSVAEACALACAGRTSVYQAIRSGALRAVKRGRKTLVLERDLRQWLETLPPIVAKRPDAMRSETSGTMEDGRHA